LLVDPLITDAPFQIDTNIGVVGYGENTPLGPNYLPAYAAGTRAGIKVRFRVINLPWYYLDCSYLFQALAPCLIGADPTKLNQINYLMDVNLKGHPYVKSAIDMACWDILGKVNISCLDLSVLIP
jgi:L-alanine-DL-glutamate epimerase-like enolase superfamily enzyme